MDGWVCGDFKTATMLAVFQAAPVDEGLELRWQFGDRAVFSTVGLERSAISNGPWAEVTGERRMEGGVTVALDREVEPGQSYYYRLVATGVSGERMVFGPLVATAGSSR